MGQLADKAHRVGDQDLRAVLHPVAFRGGVQRVEQPVVGMDAGARQRVEQGGFARIGIPHQGHQGHLPLAPFAPLGGADLAHVFQLPLEPGDALADVAPVGLQLGLAGAAGADGAAAAACRLAHQMAPHAGKARQQVLVLGQLHLQLAFAGLGPVGKNIQDQSVAVNDPALHDLLQRPGLGWGDLVVEHQQIHLVLPHQLCDLPGFALADESAGVRRGPVLHGGKDALAPRRFQQLFQLRHGVAVRMVEIRQAAAAQAHQARPLGLFFLYFLLFFFQAVAPFFFFFSITSEWSPSHRSVR